MDSIADELADDLADDLADYLADEFGTQLVPETQLGVGQELSSLEDSSDDSSESISTCLRQKSLTSTWNLVGQGV
jgi:hypothetical protein